MSNKPKNRGKNRVITEVAYCVFVQTKYGFITFMYNKAVKREQPGIKINLKISRCATQQISVHTDNKEKVMQLTVAAIVLD
jgi:hypothetical protein